MKSQQAGYPLDMKALLPHWLSVDDFYMLAAGLAAGLAVIAIGGSFYERDPSQGKRLKMLKLRREELKGQMVGRTRKRRRPEGGVDLMRRVVGRLKLLKSAQSKQVQTLLIEAGFRSKDALVVYLFFTLLMPVIFGALGLLSLSLPGGLVLNPNENVVTVEVYYLYSPILSIPMLSGIVSDTELYRVVVYKPRLGLLTQPPSS